MKFSNNKIIEEPLKFIDRIIEKMFEFELVKVQYVDARCPFNSMLNRFDKLDSLVTG